MPAITVFGAPNDPRVPLSLPREPSFADSLDPFDARGVRVGWLADLGGHLATEPGILDTCVQGLARLEACGAIVEPRYVHLLATTEHWIIGPEGR